MIEVELGGSRRGAPPRSCTLLPHTGRPTSAKEFSLSSVLPPSCQLAHVCQKTHRKELFFKAIYKMLDNKVCRTLVPPRSDHRLYCWVFPPRESGWQRPGRALCFQPQVTQGPFLPLQGRLSSSEDPLGHVGKEYHFLGSWPIS